MRFVRRLTGLVAGLFLCSSIAAQAGVVPFNPAVDIEKLINGQDADSEGQAFQTVVGAPLTFSFVVTNTGNIGLLNISVTDSVFGNICNILSLAPGASQACNYFATAELGLHSNIGSVLAFGDICTGFPVSHGMGISVGPCGTLPRRTDSDPAYYLARQAVPEPATMALLGLGLAGLAVIRRRKPGVTRH